MRSIVLLHGAIGASDQLSSLSEALKSDFNVFRMDFTGHGTRSNEEGEFSIENFALDLNGFLDTNKIVNPIIFAYSMGGYVAIYHALHFTNKAEKIITLGTKLKWTPEIAEKETGMLNPDIIEEKVPKFALQLKARHGEPQWKNVLYKTADMMKKMGENNPVTPEIFACLSVPIELGRGDSDLMVTEEETEEYFNSCEKALKYTLQDTPHPIEKVDVKNLARLIKLFIEA